MFIHMLILTVYMYQDTETYRVNSRKDVGHFLRRLSVGQYHNRDNGFISHAHVGNKRGHNSDKTSTASKHNAKKYDGNVPDSCTSEYKTLPSSTMCEFVDHPEMTSSHPTPLDIHDIVRLHNEYRSNVKPSASGMLKMYYDEEIAKIAQKYAQVCRTAHDKEEQRQIPGYGTSVGQNIAFGPTNWTETLTAWFDEVEIYKYGVRPDTYLKEGEQIGHYTQIVSDNALRIGCGSAECPHPTQPYRWNSFVCNYVYGSVNATHPYVTGPSCSQCPEHCTDNLCDCGENYCLNGGFLDKTDCSCECLGFYVGDHCQILNCPIFDNHYCSLWKNAENVCSYYNVPFECPIMCGVCEEVCPGKHASSCENGYMDADTCTCTCYPGYQGNRCHQYETCPRKSDLIFCETIWPKSFCHVYWNVPDLCPYMCEICVH